MGRIMLVVVILMGTIYAGIMTTMQRRLLSLPNIISRNMLQRQAESVSDYALRTAVRNSVILGMMAGPGEVTLWLQDYNNFNIQNCRIDSIRYQFVESASHYRAKSYVSGDLMGQHINYKAEIAFNFPLSAIIGDPNCFYLEMDQSQFNSGNLSGVDDSSANENDGLVVENPGGTDDYVSTRPNGYGVDGWKCLSLGKQNATSTEAAKGYVYVPSHPTLTIASNFSIVVWAKIRQESTVGTVIWLPSDVTDPALVANGVGVGNVRKMPTAGIWFSGGQMHFAATTVNGLNVEVAVPFTPAGKYPHNKDAWVMFGLTYDRGKVKGYINGVPVGTATNPLYSFGVRRDAVRNAGAYIGREFFSNYNSSTDSYKYMWGLIDQGGLWNRTLSDAEMLGWYNQILQPADILYIRD